MYTGAKRSVGFLGWAAGAVVTLAVAAGGSVVVPRLVSSEATPSVAGNANIEAATVATPIAGADVAVAAEAPALEVTVAEVPVAEVEVTTPPVTKAPAPRVTAPAPAPAPVVEAPAPTLPLVTVPALAARRVPSPGEVHSAIAGMKSMIPLLGLVSVTPAQVDGIGNQVCTAFDQGQSFAQVKVTGLSMVPSYVKVTPAAADYAVRTAVSMYCPAYASKLV